MNGLLAAVAIGCAAMLAAPPASAQQSINLLTGGTSGVG